MPKWNKEVMRLKEHHRWKAKPGYKIFVANAGELRLDIPVDWVVIPGPDSIRFHDRQPPDDDCLLQVSIIHLPAGVDWSGLSLADMLEEVIEDDPRVLMLPGEIISLKRPDHELAWVRARFIDQTQHREAVACACLARGSNVQPFITMDYWLDQAERFSPVWDEVLRSLRLGQLVQDPTVGPPRRSWPR